MFLSTVIISAVYWNLLALETNPFNKPFLLWLSVFYYSSIGVQFWYAPGPGSLLKYSFNSILASNLLYLVENYYSFLSLERALANDENEVSVERLDVPVKEPICPVTFDDLPL